MSLGVLNNISAIYAQNNLANTQASLSKTLQQLPSGSRINSGADDANNPLSPTSLEDKTNADAHANLGLTVIQGGIDAAMKVDGVTVTSASNTASNAIPGVTFQLLSTGTADPSATPPSIQVVIDNDLSSIEAAVSKFATDYNTAIKAINSQEGKDASGNPEPLYGTSVAAQIQEGLLTAVGASFGTNDQLADRSGDQGEPRRRWHCHSGW